MVYNAGIMEDDESSDSGLLYTLERAIGGREGLPFGLPVPPDWRGKVSDLNDAALSVFWAEALAYAKYEIRQYACWREQDEPVLSDGYDAEAAVQAAFERLIQRETGSVSIFYTAEDIHRELRMLIKHRVRWLHEKAETRLVVSEWDVLPPKPDGELVSVFDHMPGHLKRPDEELMQKEKEQLLKKFKKRFEASLGKRKQLREVFRRLWDGQKRQQIARALGWGVDRVKALQLQTKRRLTKFAARARGAMAEMLEGVRNDE